MKNQRCYNENATPRDRISRDMFRMEYGNSTPGCDGYKGRTDNPVRAVENRNDEENRSCITDNIFRGDLPLAMSYTPWQEWDDILNVEDSFGKGTIFGSLFFPFYGDSMRGECMK